MNVLLIDVDSRIPNLALMQISSYLKSKWHNVGFNVGDPDQIYISCVFKKNKAQAESIKSLYPQAKIIIGGSGINYDWLPVEMQKVMPDYELYPSTYSMGFTTRGCIRQCPFCIVKDKEGNYKKWQHPKEFHNDKFNTIMLLDNNWIANRNWFYETSQWIIDNDLSVIEHGIDIRIMDWDIANRLRDIKFAKTLHFAWDNLEDESYICNGLSTLKSVGFNLRSEIQFYVLVGYNTTPEQDKYRCRRLKEMGTNAFVMPYVKNKWTNQIARWANRKWLYWSIDIDDYASHNNRAMNADAPSVGARHDATNDGG